MFANKKMQKVSLQSSHGQPCTRCNTRRCFNDSDVLLCLCIYNYIAFICNSYTLYRGVDYRFRGIFSVFTTLDVMKVLSLRPQFTVLRCHLKGFIHKT
ncbi:hypothetical protein Hanom_Chr01g00080371 [Helianthus anomalus]